MQHEFYESVKIGRVLKVFINRILAIFSAEGKRSGLVDTNESFYYPYGIKYKGLKLLDVSQTNIKVHFFDVAEYIDEALSSGGQ